jgi:hypothetical protein
MTEVPQPIDTKRLPQAQAAAHHYRDLLKQKADLEERLRATNSELENYAREQLPDLMDQAGIDRIGLPAQGNDAACDLTLVPYYKAVIPQNWSAERKAAAFSALTAAGHEDLIKTVITVTLPRHERRQAARILAAMEQFSVDAQVSESVHWKILTAWVKDQFERHAPLPPLDVIGAEIGRIVALKERR